MPCACKQRHLKSSISRISYFFQTRHVGVNREIKQNKKTNYYSWDWPMCCHFVHLRLLPLHEKQSTLTSQNTPTETFGVCRDSGPKTEDIIVRYSCLPSSTIPTTTHFNTRKTYVLHTYYLMHTYHVITTCHKHTEICLE